MNKKSLQKILTAGASTVAFMTSIASNVVASEKIAWSQTIANSMIPRYFYEAGSAPGDFTGTVKRGPLKNGDYIGSFEYTANPLNIYPNNENNILHLKGINANRKIDGENYPAVRLGDVNVYKGKLAVGSIKQDSTQSGRVVIRVQGGEAWFTGENPFNPSAAPDYSGIHVISGSNLYSNIDFDTATNPVAGGGTKPAAPIDMNAEIAGYNFLTVNARTDTSLAHPRSGLTRFINIGGASAPATLKFGDIKQEIRNVGQSAYAYTYVMYHTDSHVKFENEYSTFHLVSRVPDPTKDNAIYGRYNLSLGGEKDDHGQVILEGDDRGILLIYNNFDIGRNEKSRAKSLKIIGKDDVVVSAGNAIYTKYMEYESLGADKELVIRSNVFGGKDSTIKLTGNENTQPTLRLNANTIAGTIDLNGFDANVEIAKNGTKNYSNAKGNIISVTTTNGRAYTDIVANAADPNAVGGDVLVSYNGFHGGDTHNLKFLRGGDTSRQAYLHGKKKVQDVLLTGTGQIWLEKDTEIQKTSRGEGGRVNGAYADLDYTLPGYGNFNLRPNSVIEGSVGANQRVNSLNFYSWASKPAKAELRGDVYAQYVVTRTPDINLRFADGIYVKPDIAVQLQEYSTMTVGNNVHIDGLFRPYRNLYGSAVFEGNAVVNRISDATGRRFTKVELQGPGTVVSQDDIYTYALTFKDKDAELVVGDRSDIRASITAEKGGGKVVFNDHTNIYEGVGTKKLPLGEMVMRNTITDGDYVRIYGDAYIEKVILEGANTRLDLMNHFETTEGLIFTNEVQRMNAYIEDQERIGGPIIAAYDGVGAVMLHRNGSIIDGQIGTQDRHLRILANSAGVSTIKGDVYADHIGSGSGDTLVFEGNVYAKQLHSSGGTNRGNIIFKKNAMIESTAGVQDTTLPYIISRNNMINIVADGGANDVVTIGGDIRVRHLDIFESQVHLGGNVAYSLGIRFKHATDGMLKVYNNVGDRNLDIVYPQGSEATGTIWIDESVGANQVNFPGAVGSADNALKLLDVDAKHSEIKFSATYNNIKNVEMNGGALYFTAPSTINTRFDNVTLEEDKSTILRFGQDVRFVSPESGVTTNLGTEHGNKLKYIKFDSDRLITLSDGVNLFADHIITDIKKPGTSWGRIDMQGNSTFSAPTIAPSGDHLNALRVSGQLSDIARLVGKHKFGGAVVALDSTLEIDSSIEASSIHGWAPKRGALRTVAKNGAIYVDGPVGNVGNNTFASVEAAGKYDTYYKQDVHMGAGDRFIFKGEDDIRAIFEGAGSDIGKADYANQNTINANGDIPVGTVVLPATMTVFTGNLGDDGSGDNLLSFGNNILKFQLGPNANASFAAANMKNVDFCTSESGTGMLDLAMVNPYLMQSLGSMDKKFEEVKFSTSGHEVANSIYAKDIIVDAAASAKFGGEVHADNAMTVGGTSIFKDGIELHAAIEGAVAGSGVLEFEGHATIHRNIGETSPLAKIAFADDATKTNVLKAGIISATNIDFMKSNVILDANIYATGAVSLNDTKMNLNDKDLIVDGMTTINGNTELTFTILDELAGGFRGGQIQTNGLTFGAGSVLTLNIEDSISHREAGLEYDAIINSGTFSGAPTIVVNDGYDPTSTWTAAASAGGVKLTLASVTPTPGIEGTGIGEEGEQGDQGDQGPTGDQGVQGNNGPKGIQGNVGPQGAVGIQGVQGNNGPKGGQGPQGVVGAPGPQGPAGVAGATIPGATTTGGGGTGGSGGPLTVAPSTTLSASGQAAQGEISEQLDDTGRVVANDLGDHAGGLPSFDGFVMNTEGQITGTSAGYVDDAAKYGAWINPFYKITTQKKYKEDAGFKAETFGVNAGLDFRASEDVIVGGAFTFSSKDIKHKDQKKGDKTKLNSYMLSMYALGQITDRVFTDVIATVGVHNVHIRDVRVNPTNQTTETARAKYEAMSFAFEGLMGAKFATKYATFIPSAGVRYTRVASASYEEKDAGINNTVKLKAINDVSAIADLKIAAPAFKFAELDVSPSIHAGILHDLVGKKPSQEISSSAGNAQNKARKVIRTEYTFGAEINAENGRMEYGIGYDFKMAKKRISHLGTLTVRVNF